MNPDVCVCGHGVGFHSTDRPCLCGCKKFQPSGPATVVVPWEPTPAMLIEGARALDAWSDDTLREEIDVTEMARRVWKAMTSNVV